MADRKIGDLDLYTEFDDGAPYLVGNNYKNSCAVRVDGYEMIAAYLNGYMTTSADDYTALDGYLSANSLNYLADALDQASTSGDPSDDLDFVMCESSPSESGIYHVNADNYLSTYLSAYLPDYLDTYFEGFPQESVDSYIGHYFGHNRFDMTSELFLDAFDCELTAETRFYAYKGPDEDSQGYITLGAIAEYIKNH